MPISPKPIQIGPNAGGHDARRANSHQRGYTRMWSKARAVYLAHNPLCKLCEDQGVITPATQVDHIIPHRGNYELFWDPENWQGLCASCHSKKTKAGL